MPNLVAPRTIFVVVGGRRYEGFADKLDLEARLENWWSTATGTRQFWTFTIYSDDRLIYRGITRPTESRDEAGNMTYTFGPPSDEEMQYVYMGS